MGILILVSEMVNDVFIVGNVINFRSPVFIYLNESSIIYPLEKVRGELHLVVEIYL